MQSQFEEQKQYNITHYLNHCTCISSRGFGRNSFYSMQLLLKGCENMVCDMQEDDEKCNKYLE